MAMLILEETVEKELIRRRQMHGHDRFDEVWDGVYVMSPSADNQHQGVSTDLATVFQVCIDWNGLGKSMATPNVSDRVEDWTQNFRIPDLAVFLVGTTAIDYQSFWHGGPDFVVEIASENDKTDEKLPFYESVQTREVLIVDRNPWRLRLYRPVDSTLLLVATSTLDQSAELRSDIVPLSFRLALREGKPVILVTKHVTSQTWTI